MNRREKNGLTCREVRSLMSPALDGALSPDEKNALESHCERCPTCQKELTDLRKVVHAVGTLARLKAPEGLGAAVRARLHSRVIRRWEMEGPGWWRVALAASVALAMGVSVWQWQRTQRSRIPTNAFDERAPETLEPEPLSTVPRKECDAPQHGQPDAEKVIGAQSDELTVPRPPPPVPDKSALARALPRADRDEPCVPASPPARRRETDSSEFRREAAEKAGAAARSRADLPSVAVARTRAGGSEVAKRAIFGRSAMDSPLRNDENGESLFMSIRVKGVRAEDVEAVLGGGGEGKRQRAVAAAPPQEKMVANGPLAAFPQRGGRTEEIFERQTKPDGSMEWRLKVSGPRYLELVKALRRLDGVGLEVPEPDRTEILESSSNVLVRIILESGAGQAIPSEVLQGPVDPEGRAAE